MDWRSGTWSHWGEGMFFTAIFFVFYPLVSLVHTPHSTHVTVSIATEYVNSVRMPKDKSFLYEVNACTPTDILDIFVITKCRLHSQTLKINNFDFLMYICNHCGNENEKYTHQSMYIECTSNVHQALLD